MYFFLFFSDYKLFRKTAENSKNDLKVKNVAYI